MSIYTLRNLLPYPEGHALYNPTITQAVREHEEKWGSFNDTPPGWREITESDFVKSTFFSHEPGKIEFRQLVNAGLTDEQGAPLICARLYYFHDGTGVALMNDFWAGKLRYFAFGCNHKWREVYGEEATNLGFRALYSQEHAYVCEECGETKLVDTSG